MTVALPLVDICFAQRRYPVDQHAARIGKYNSGFQAFTMIGGGRDLVGTGIAEIIRPALKAVVVNAACIVCLHAQYDLKSVLRLHWGSSLTGPCGRDRPSRSPGP